MIAEKHLLGIIHKSQIIQTLLIIKKTKHFLKNLRQIKNKEKIKFRE